MKNKRTKFTAILLSALMAVSTISSVTWAADLFSDGSKTEVANITEVTEIGEDALVTAENEASATKVVFDSEGVYYEADTGTFKLDVTFIPTHKDDSGDVVDDTDKQWTEPKTVTNVGMINPATCQNPQRDRCTFEYNGTSYDAFYVYKDDWKENVHHRDKTVTYKVISTATCKDGGAEGKSVTYTVCEYCKGIKPVSGYVSGQPYDTVSATDLDTEYASLDTSTSGNATKHLIVVSTPALKHKFGDSYKTTDENSNCTISSSGQVQGPVDPNQDAYYLLAHECLVCHKIETIDKVYIYYADMTEGETFYLAGENVKGFLDANGNYVAGRIDESDFKDAVLLDDSKGGIYYLCVANKDGSYATVKPFTKKAGHTWGKLSAVPYSGELDDNFAHVYDKNGNLVLKQGTDENGNPALYSINCTATAYYELEQYCLSCNTKNTAVSGRRKALQGDHLWEILEEQDPAETVYTIIDEKHHLEHYRDHVKCELCKKEDIIDSQKYPDTIKDHSFTPQEIEGTRIEPKCGSKGSFQRADTCVCGYIDESTPRTTVTLPETDEHEFGDNEIILQWTGEVYIKNANVDNRSYKVTVGRKCKECDLIDANGINGTVPTAGDIKGYPLEIKVKDIVDAKKDPATGISYRCSTAHATLYVDCLITVDGELVTVNSNTIDNAIVENVPYYASSDEYQARTAHTPGKPQKEGDEIVTRCTVCGDVVSREPDTTPTVDVPTVSAASVDYDTINVSWTKVDGATAYRLYFRSSDEGISMWQKIRTFTSEADSYAVSGLTTGSKYRFTVRAEVTQDGKTTLGDYSRKGAVAVPKLTTPEIKSVTASGKTTKVTWSRVDGASGYIVFRNSQRVGTVTKGSKATWTDKKPVSGAKYQIRAYRTEDKKNFKSDLSEPK